MADVNGITPVMNVGNGDSMFGGNSAFMWIFALLILAGGGFGGLGGWGNNSNQFATRDQVQQGFDTQNSIAQSRDIMGAVTAGTSQAVAATNQTFHDTLGAMQSLYNETARDIAAVAVGQANILANQNECCGRTTAMIADAGASLSAQIAQNKYEAAMRDAATNANFTAQIQGVKDMMAQDKIEALQAQVSQLQLAQATSGVLRFPNQWSYGAGPFPPIFGCCGQANI